MERYKININSPRVKPFILVGISDDNRSITAEGGVVTIHSDIKHDLSVNDIVYFRKRSGTGDTNSWEVYSESPCRVIEVVDEMTFKAQEPAYPTSKNIINIDFNDCTSSSTDTDCVSDSDYTVDCCAESGYTGVFTFDEDYEFLPEDIVEMGGITGTVNTSEIVRLYPVYRKRNSMYDEAPFNPDYDRALINFKAFGFEVEEGGVVYNTVLPLLFVGGNDDLNRYYYNSEEDEEAEYNKVFEEEDNREDSSEDESEEKEESSEDTEF